MLLIAGAVVLALLALAGVAGVLRRRRRAREEEEAWTANDWNEPINQAPAEAAVAAPAAEPTVATAPERAADSSAFAWGDAPKAAAAPTPELPEGIEAAPGSHVEAAYLGPTPDNPSLSLRKRLKRAAFFDQREQLAAAGEAAPVDADAGLPEDLAEPEPTESDAATSDRDRQFA